LGDTDVNPPVLKHIQAKAALQKYIIQVASFKRYEDADELKARLVMMGFEATIKDAPSGGITWKRVWLGPFNSLQEAAQVQQRLAQNHIQGVVGRLRVEK
jgi:cell division protein FtsN